MKTLSLFILGSVALIGSYLSLKTDVSFVNTEAAYQIIQQDTTLQNSIERGKTVYEDFCMQCHMATGEGIPGAFTPLAKADYLLENRTKAIHAVNTVL